MSQSNETERLRTVLVPRTTELGLDLEAVEASNLGRRRLLRLVVDKDGGVSLDDIADATRALSAAIDDSDAMGERAYTLEVTSPGVDRPLTRPRHWRRNADRLVTVALRDGTRVTGRITRADDDTVVVAVDGSERTLAFADVAKATVQVELNRKET